MTLYRQEGILHRDFGVLSFDLLYKLQALPTQGNVEERKKIK
jgi:hypothetical protein